MKKHVFDHAPPNSPFTASMIPSQTLSPIVHCLPSGADEDRLQRVGRSKVALAQVILKRNPSVKNQNRASITELMSHIRCLQAPSNVSQSHDLYTCRWALTPALNVVIG